MEKLVIATDGGPASHAALDWVIDRARKVPVEVEVVTVEELRWLPLGADETEFREKYADELESAASYLGTHHGISSVSTNLVAGEPADAIAEIAAGADALVIGSPRRSDSVGALRGTLALRLAARVPTRMTVVPSDWTAGADGVVVGLDDDDSSDVALDFAADEAARLGAEVILVHAWTLPTPFTVLEGLLPTTYPALEAVHREILDTARKRLLDRHADIRVRTVMRFGHPAEVLDEVARQHSQVIIGTHRRGRAGDLFLGSNGHDLLMAAPTPVTIVPNVD